MSKRYAGIKLNDVANGEGVCVSYWSQGCPHRCPGCHNPETWNPSGGMKYTTKVLDEIILAISKNGVNRNFSVLGGEPLAEYNLDQTYEVVSRVRELFPNIRIYLWTGYLLEHLTNNSKAMSVLDNVDILIDGLFVEELKDLSLELRGSSNQRVIDLNAYRTTGNIENLT